MKSYIKVLSSFNVFVSGDGCGLGKASFQKEKRCNAQRAMIEQQHWAFAATCCSHALVKDVRVTCTILALELNTGSSSYFNDVRKKILPYFLERGLLFRPLGNVIYILPPYVITAGQLGEVYGHIEGFLKEGWGVKG